jgi:geranylgeranyl pyrophosphate synthase
MSSASDFTVDAAWDWGLSLGVGYQLVNDLKDVDVAGGGTGHDLQAGLLTEPWLYAGGALRRRLGRVAQAIGPSPDRSDRG